jgi:hypothetical protein
VEQVQILHAIEGRLRIRVSAMKAESVGRTYAERLRCMSGISDVQVNPLTGSMIIRYDPAIIGRAALLQQIGALFGAPVRRDVRGSRNRFHDRSLQRQLTHAILKSVVEVAIKRAVLALI